jgi:hypothetical protein
MLDAGAHDVGVRGHKLILVDKQASAGKAKLVFVSKLDPEIHKGPGSDVDGVSGLSGSVTVAYRNEGGHGTNVEFVVRPPNWNVNRGDVVAKFVNRSAP